MDEVQDAFRSESVMITLTRMEGKMDRVGDQVIDTKARVMVLEAAVQELKSVTQTLGEGAVSSKETAKALALALKEADEQRRTKDDVTWTPFARSIAAIGMVLAAIGVWYQLTH